MNLFVRSSIVRKIMLMMVLIPAVSIFLFPCNAVSATTDTTWTASFRLNMTKAVNQHIFVPDSDYVYLIMDSVQPFRLIPGPGFTYTGIVVKQLYPGVTYNYHFRINDSIPEAVTRSFTAALPDTVSVSVWWNNEPINITSFIVNMAYAVQYGMFNAANDSVCIVGTMNNMQGSPKLQRIDTTLNYIWIDTLLVPGSVQQYKYRINADSSGLELLNQPARIVRIPDTLLQVTSDFNNFNPAKRLMSFNCDMKYYIKAHHFDTAADYLDVAGNFNGYGANDALFDVDGDSIYSLKLFMDTAWIHQGPLAFKFRINGDWNTAELTEKPNRTYVFHDTIQQNPNIYTCHYNNLDPSVPTPPWVENVGIQGLLIHKKFLSGIYSYENVNGILEGISTYRWLRSSNAQGTEATPIDSAWGITHIVDTLDIAKWLVFEVTPVAASGDSAVGKPVRVVSSINISAWDIGIGENTPLITRVYPNPASDYLMIESPKQMARIELINYLNQTVLTKNDISSSSCKVLLGNIPGGIYFMKVTAKTGEWGVERVVKY